MGLEELVSLITIVVTLILGEISKKIPKIKNNLIPIQNLLVGTIVAIVEWIITKDFNSAIALSGLIAGGTYDIIHNLEKIIRKKDGE